MLRKKSVRRTIHPNQPVDRNENAKASEFPKGYFYFFAFVPGKETYWGGDRANTCVSSRGNFERIATPNYSCRDGEVLVPFAEIQVTQDVHTINLD